MESSHEKKKTKSEQTKDKIIAKYISLITKKRWDKVSVKELCSEVDITRGTFYQYFDDIYDLMDNIQSTLLEDMNQRYASITYNIQKNYSSTHFKELFDFTPPPTLINWFEFCKNNRKAVAALIDPNFGDSYFVKKVKSKLFEHINLMMDNDGMPRDGLRQHFTKVFVELHFLSARTWLEGDEENFLSTQEIINLLNTMRVGANYLSYKEHTDPDFHSLMDNLS